MKKSNNPTPQFTPSESPVPVSPITPILQECISTFMQQNALQAALLYEIQIKIGELHGGHSGPQKPDTVARDQFSPATAKLLECIGDMEFNTGRLEHIKNCLQEIV